MSAKRKLRLGLPKGSLQDATIEKMAKAGFHVSVSSRSYIPYVDDEELEIRLIRAQEISRYVEHGYLDCGITGHDWIIENGSKVHEVGEFIFSKVSSKPTRWVLCVPEESSVKSVKDLKGKRIATEVVNLTKKYLRKNKVKAEVEFSWGATEVRERTKSSGGCHRGSDRDRFFTAREQTAYCGYAVVVHAAVGRQSRFVERQVEAAKDRDAGVVIKGRAGKAESKVGLRDEHVAEKNLARLLKELPACAIRRSPVLAQKGWVAEWRAIIDEARGAGIDSAIESRGCGRNH